MKKSFYVVLVSREEDGSLRRVPVPLKFAWMFAGAAVVGLFTIAGLAGSYSRMLLKTERFNQLRQEHNTLLGDYAKLQKREHEKEVQAASLGALASEVSALYGLTAKGIASSTQGVFGRGRKSAGTETAVIAPTETTSADAGFSNANYYKSLQAFYSLRNTAMDGSMTRAISNSFAPSGLGNFGIGANLTGSNIPTLWPVLGSISSPFGGRQDPILGNGEGEFHKGVDISAPYGTPIRATADGVVQMAGMGNGYGREVVINHGGGVETTYAHMSGFHVSAGEQVVRGQVIGYVGTSGRSTGAHVHYEVRLRNVPVNPHKYLRDSVNGIGTEIASK
ncbi:M23 family metallopeptidase [Terriglobus roseus]|uniref:M23 family metallopeptidase n=1 Tax=Terriglobus roseus TaxID=392734 RepID=UPI0009F5705F|nr:M23 family metallopeptidase [Terriglobus roseus]